MGRLGGGEGRIRTPGAPSSYMGAIRAEFGALFDPNKSISAGENMFASDPASAFGLSGSFVHEADPRNLLTPTKRPYFVSASPGYVSEERVGSERRREARSRRGRLTL
jgi:hypothetical protein